MRQLKKQLGEQKPRQNHHHADEDEFTPNAQQNPH
jgi:hypothetical protein